MVAAEEDVLLEASVLYLLEVEKYVLADGLDCILLAWFSSSFC